MAQSTMRDKICLVTGATGGIGEVTARALATNGATVVLVGRSQSKAEATVAKIKRETGNQNVEFMLADLSVQKDVRRLADEFKAKYDRLHVLVNNAGAVYMKRQESADGIELTFALNHLAYFLLTNLLLDTLKASAPARVINVSSSAHQMGKMDWDDLQGRKKFTGMRIYGRSKLANILFTREMARRLAGSGVTVNALHPGVVTTGFGVNNGFMGQVGRKLMDFFSISAEQGAQTTIYLATSPEVEGVTGKYFYKQKEATPTAAAQNDADARTLWETSEKLVGVA